MTYFVYKLIPSVTRPGKTDKIPVDPYHGHNIDHLDPANHMAKDMAAAFAAGLGSDHGVGMLIQPPLFFLDIDGDLASDLPAMFPGAYVEMSSSGTGYHVIGSYSGPRPDHRTRPTKDHPDLALELYTDKRFAALTPYHLGGDMSTDCTVALYELIARYFTRDERLANSEWTTGPAPDWSGPVEDDQLISMMLASKPSAAVAFGGRMSLQQLWQGESSGDHSTDDAALCSHLAFWTGKDCERIDRLFRTSGQYREKWERDDYRESTILGAVAVCKQVLQARAPIAPPADMMADQVVVNEGSQFFGPEQQLQLFKGCTYVIDHNAVLLPNGSMVKSEQFRAIYGGRIFTLDSGNRTTTPNAWVAFTESQMIRYPMANKTCFRPGLAPGAIVDDEGIKKVNTFVPVPVRRTVGDAGPFLRHVEKILPIERDRQIVLSYMAACVQHQGVKFQWCPLLQGVPGNGKTLLTRCVARAVGRRYTMLPQAHEIGSKFNSWLADKIFIGVEDIYVPEEERMVLEVLKPMITGGDGLGIQAKGKDQETREICANFILNSNHKDALKKEKDDRRLAIFYTPQQTVEDLAACGMGGDYFPDLYDWLKADGYAIVTEYLFNYPIVEEFNPATVCQRAPLTSSTEEAIAMSHGTIEQEVQEAVAEGRYGFKGGWLCSTALAGLLESMRKQISQNKRRELMQRLGYIPHPGLPDGRSNVEIDGKKPRLYVLKGHLSINLSSPPAIIAAYKDAQGIAGVAPAFSQPA